MKLQGKLVSVMILVVVGFGEWAHCQPMISNYQIQLDDRLWLVHSSRDAFWVLDQNDEVLMIDPVWDNIELDAYSKLPTALLIRTHNTNPEKQPPGASASYFIVERPTSNAIAHSTGPLPEKEFRERLLSMSINSGDVAWVVPAEPNPAGKRMMLFVLFAMFTISMSGHLLPIPFALVLVHYLVLKKRLHRLTGNVENASPV